MAPRGASVGAVKTYTTSRPGSASNAKNVRGFSYDAALLGVDRMTVRKTDVTASPNACPDCGHPAHPDRACGHTIKRREFDGRREYVCACGRAPQ